MDTPTTEKISYRPDDLVHWHFERSVFGPLVRAGIVTIGDLQARLDEIRHGDIRGIGAGRIAIITEFAAKL